MRWKLTIEYDGRPYRGWQYQEGMPTVQGAIEAAIVQLCGEHSRMQVAGRTDAGVHALAQVAHFDTQAEREAARIVGGLNYYLREEAISILKAESVSEQFHARFSATGRAYRYRILNRAAPPAVDRGRVWHVPEAMDLEAMRRAAECFIGTHDFSSVRASECQSKSPIKTLDSITIAQVGEEVHCYFSARSFLHHQVRNIVGCLRKVALGQWPVEKIPEVLAARDRTAAAETAPAEGLYLTEVRY